MNYLFLNAMSTHPIVKFQFLINKVMRRWHKLLQFVFLSLRVSLYQWSESDGSVAFISFYRNTYLCLYLSTLREASCYIMNYQFYKYGYVFINDYKFLSSSCLIRLSVHAQNYHYQQA